MGRAGKSQGVHSAERLRIRADEFVRDDNIAAAWVHVASTCEARVSGPDCQGDSTQ